MLRLYQNEETIAFCPLKPQEKTRKIRQEATTSLAAAKEIRLDCLFETGGIFVLNEDQRTAPKASLSGKQVYAVLQTGFGESLVKRCDVQRLATLLMSPLAPIGILCPSTNSFYGLFTRRMGEINPNVLGNGPSRVHAWSLVSHAQRQQLSFRSSRPLRGSSLDSTLVEACCCKILPNLPIYFLRLVKIKAKMPEIKLQNERKQKATNIRKSQHVLRWNLNCLLFQFF